VRARPSILIVDGNEHASALVEVRLEALNAACVREYTGASAIRTAARSPFDLIILASETADKSWLEIRRELRHQRATAGIPILLTLGGTFPHAPPDWLDLEGDTFLHRDDFDRYLLSNVRLLLDRPRKRLYPFPAEEVTISVLCHSDCPVVFRAAGAFFQVRVASLNKRTEIAGVTVGYDIPRAPRKPIRWHEERFGNSNLAREQFKVSAANKGARIFEALFQQHKEFMECYVAAKNSRVPDRIRMRFTVPSTLIQVPFEWVYDHTDTFGYPRHLALKHAMARIVTDCETRREPINAAFLNRLHADREPLRVLIIGFDPRQDLEGVADEVKMLGQEIPRWFAAQGILVDKPEVVPPEIATYENVTERLRACKHHIVHFAGHTQRNDRPAENALLLRSEQGGQRGLTARDLSDLLRDSHARFIYLGCCHTAETDIALPADNPFLGITEAVVHAGVPAALTFLLPPRDKEAAAFSARFYQDLAKAGDLDMALLRTRQHFGLRDPGDERWASPVLILQH
jgi:DNA-binding response OmpR family regulator